MALLTNTPTEAESLLHSLEQAAGGIGLQVNTDKTESMCVNQKGSISSLNGGSLKLADKLTYLKSSVSFIKMTSICNVWTSIVRLSIKGKPNLSIKIKRIFSISGRVNSTIWMQHIDAD